MDWQWIDSNKFYIVGVLCAIAIISIFIMYFFGDVAGIDKKYNMKLTEIPATTIDMWSLSHLILYFLIGLIAPNYYITVLLVSIGWEKVEAELGNGGSMALVKCDKARRFGNSDILHLCQKGRDSYWYHKWDDLLINIVGYIFGSAVRNEYAPVKQ